MLQGLPTPSLCLAFPQKLERNAHSALTLNQFETGRAAFSQPGSRGPCLQDQDEALSSSQGGSPGPSSHRLSLSHLLPGSAFTWGTLMIEIPVRHRPVTSAEAEAGPLKVQGPPWLQNEFKAILSDLPGPCLQTQTKKSWWWAELRGLLFAWHAGGPTSNFRFLSLRL